MSVLQGPFVNRTFQYNVYNSNARYISKDLNVSVTGGTCKNNSFVCYFHVPMQFNIIMQ